MYSLERLFDTLEQLPGLLIGLTVHEFAHAWSGSLLGDDFARRQGRVSLNPFRHLTLLGTLALLLLHFGWGKPVPVNLYNYKHPKRDYLLTSLAGPAANVLLMILSLGLLYLSRHTFVFGDDAVPWMLRAHRLLIGMAIINAVLAMVNLVPIPPLDGSKIWPCLIPGRTASFTAANSRWMVIVVIVLFANGVFDPVFKAGIQRLQVFVPPSDLKVFNDNYAAAGTAWKARHPDQAEALLTKALSINPNSRIALVSRANIRSERRNWQGALEDISAAIRLAPTRADYYRSRASIRVFLGQTKEIQEDLATYHRLGGPKAEASQPAREQEQEEESTD